MLRIYTSIFGTSPGEREAGASVVDSKFIRWASVQGHCVTVVVPKGRDIGVSVGANGSVMFSGTMGAGWGWHLMRLVRTACLLVNLYRADRQGVFRVNSFFSSLIEIIPLVVYSRGRVRLFVQFHHKDCSRLRNAIVRQVLSWAQVIVCPSDAARQELVELFGYLPVGLHRVHHGVDEKFFIVRPTPQITALVPQPLRLLFVGHLERRKNPSVLLELAAALYGRVSFELTIVGKGPELETLNRCCHDQPWASIVSLVGEVSDEKKLEEYAKADLLVFSSKQEGFGLVLCEAMAAGVPVLAFNISAMPEIVQPGTGYLVEVDDVAAMTEVVRSLAHDRVHLSRMSNNAVQHAKSHFSWPHKVAEICGLLESTFQPAKESSQARLC